MMRGSRLATTAAVAMVLSMPSPSWAAATEPLWVSSFVEPGRDVFARSMGVDTVRGTVYVAGTDMTLVPDGLGDYVTVAYDTAGATLWSARYDGPFHGDDRPTDLAVDSATGTVYVTGASRAGKPGSVDFATVAYDRFGTELWTARYDDPRHTADVSRGIAVDPNTGTIFVTGETGSGLGGTDEALTVAYSPAGQELWAARFEGTRPIAINVDPNTGNLFVSGDNWTTVAYDAAGTELWVSTSDPPVPAVTASVAAALDPGTGQLYVIGSLQNAPPAAPRSQGVVAAYSLAGELLWTQRVQAWLLARGDDAHLASIAVDPVTGYIYVAGRWDTTPSNDRYNSDIVTYAFYPDGQHLFRDRYDDLAEGFDEGIAVGVNPVTGDYYVTGSARGGAVLTTVAYDVQPGSRLRVGVVKYAVPHARPFPSTVLQAVDPSTGNVYVAASFRQTTGAAATAPYGITTIAYSTLDDGGRTAPR